MRRILHALWALPVAAAMMLSPAAQAATIGTLDGYAMPPGSLQTSLPGLCAPPNTCQVVAYNNFGSDPNAGAQELAAFLSDDPSRSAVGYSLGGASITAYLLSHDPVPGQWFITFGDPDWEKIPADTGHDVTVVVHQYDPVSDVPNDPSSPGYFLAWINLFSSLGQHCCYSDADLTNPDAVRWSDGNVDHVLIPTPVLPMLQGWTWLGQPVYDLNAQWQPLVESAYTYPARPAPTATQEVVSSTIANADTAQAITSNSDSAKLSSATAETTTLSASATAAATHPRKTGETKRADTPAAATHPRKTGETKRADTPAAKDEAKEQRKADRKQ